MAAYEGGSTEDVPTISLAKGKFSDLKLAISTLIEVLLQSAICSERVVALPEKVDGNKYGTGKEDRYAMRREKKHYGDTPVPLEILGDALLCQPK
uniref:DZF domain-containing protein n=1 Tax=Ascaris lumbricoides TaxID=6252 RepID=A0A0M3HTE4_ASCLU